MPRLSLAAALVSVLLAGCQAPESHESAAPEATESAAETVAVPTPTPTAAETRANAAPESGQADDSGCGADKLGRWLNLLPTADVKREIAAAVGERPIRYYTQGDPITLDFSPERLNVELGEDGRIKLFRCG